SHAPSSMSRWQWLSTTGCGSGSGSGGRSRSRCRPCSSSVARLRVGSLMKVLLPDLVDRVVHDPLRYAGPRGDGLDRVLAGLTGALQIGDGGPERHGIVGDRGRARAAHHDRDLATHALLGPTHEVA